MTSSRRKLGTGMARCDIITHFPLVRVLGRGDGAPAGLSSSWPRSTIESQVPASQELGGVTVVTSRLEPVAGRRDAPLQLDHLGAGSLVLVEPDRLFGLLEFSWFTQHGIPPLRKGTRNQLFVCDMALTHSGRATICGQLWIDRVHLLSVGAGLESDCLGIAWHALKGRRVFRAVTPFASLRACHRLAQNPG